MCLIGDPGTPEKGTQDPELLRWIETNEYILVTRNVNTIPAHLADYYQQGHHIPGIFWIRGDASVGQIVEELLLIWEIQRRQSISTDCCIFLCEHRQ